MPGDLQWLLERLPRVSYAVAYGSAVMKQVWRVMGDASKGSVILACAESLNPKWQKGYKGSNMVDYIFAIENAAEVDLTLNTAFPDEMAHYSLLGLLGGESLQNIQETGAGVYFNVPYADNGRKAKYAVISKSRLCSELHEWKNLYISGRLQKPPLEQVQTLVHNEDVESANLQNLRNALSFEQDVSPIRRAELFTQLPQEILDRAAKRCNLISQAGSMTIEAQNEGLKNVIFSNPNIVKGFACVDGFGSAQVIERGPSTVVMKVESITLLRSASLKI
eukprot:752431-Hanusia_phi.AAC.1